MSISDIQLLTQMQYTMIEPVDGGLSWQSGLWTAQEVLNYLNQRQNRFLKDTQMQIGLAMIPAAAGTLQYDLPDDWITTVRVVWISSDRATRELIRSNAWEADNGIPSWTYVAGAPIIYIDVDTPVLTIKVAPLPDEDGTIQVQYVPLAGLLTGQNITPLGEPFTLPDEFVPYVKYGALADMWSKVGRGMDPERAAYCQDRYMMGVEIGKMMLMGWKK
jgi:hypothetical protein